MSRCTMAGPPFAGRAVRPEGLDPAHQPITNGAGCGVRADRVPAGADRLEQRDPASADGRRQPRQQGQPGPDRLELPGPLPTGRSSVA